MSNPQQAPSWVVDELRELAGWFEDKAENLYGSGRPQTRAIFIGKAHRLRYLASSLEQLHPGDSNTCSNQGDTVTITLSRGAAEAVMAEAPRSLLHCNEILNAIRSTLNNSTPERGK